jgi:hypothetical protein
VTRERSALRVRRSAFSVWRFEEADCGKAAWRSAYAICKKEWPPYFTRILIYPLFRTPPRKLKITAEPGAIEWILPILHGEKIELEDVF